MKILHLYTVYASKYSVFAFGNIVRQKCLIVLKKIIWPFQSVLQSTKG